MFLRFSICHISLFVFATFITAAQYQPQFYLRATEAAERVKTHERIIQNVILKNLSFPLSDETEHNWQGAFNAMEVVDYQDAFTWQKMQEAMMALPFQSITFQRHTLEAAYALYPGDFMHETPALMRVTTDPKIFAMCAVYLFKSDPEKRDMIFSELHKSFGDSAFNQPILSRLINYLRPDQAFSADIDATLRTLLSKSFLPGHAVLYSFQRKNRDYPGLALVRKANGEFVETNGKLFHVAQLARGISNLPYFLTKGNTPQGIYRMFGFGVSQSQFIGPTANVQMGMPVELSKNKFFNTKQYGTGGWSRQDYAGLLPASLRNFEPLYETWYAGLAGRNEIIAHGTTINPDYYKGKPYYPMTPTEGCLCTREFWNGKIIESDQQKLVNALLAAGGAYGYVVVIELDDAERPVILEDILGYMDKPS